MIICIQMEFFMPYFASVIMYYHVKIACYQCVLREREREFFSFPKIVPYGSTAHSYNHFFGSHLLITNSACFHLHCGIFNLHSHTKSCHCLCPSPHDDLEHQIDCKNKVLILFIFHLNQSLHGILPLFLIQIFPNIFT